MTLRAVWWSGFPASDPEFGFVHCLDGRRRVTIATADLDYHELLCQALGMLAGRIDLDPSKYVLTVQGWPGDWEVRADRRKQPRHQVRRLA